jgi:hypothetical protein
MRSISPTLAMYQQKNLNTTHTFMTLYMAGVLIIALTKALSAPSPAPRAGHGCLVSGKCFPASTFRHQLGAMSTNEHAPVQAGCGLSLAAPLVDVEAQTGLGARECSGRLATPNCL